MSEGTQTIPPSLTQSLPGKPKQQVYQIETLIISRFAYSPGFLLQTSKVLCPPASLSLETTYPPLPRVAHLSDHHVE